MQSTSNFDVRKIINKFPNQFLIIQAEKGFFGSTIYRAIAGSDPKFLWKFEYSNCPEKLGPLEWPRYTEGFNIYDGSSNPYTVFKENHLATAHIGLPVIKRIEKKHLRDVEKDKILIIKSRSMNEHYLLKCKIIHAYGKLKDVVDLSHFREDIEIKPVEANNNVFNLNIKNFMSDDFDPFCSEYLEMCAFLDIAPNINNVRQFILLLKDKINRFKLSQKYER